MLASLMPSKDFITTFASTLKVKAPTARDWQRVKTLIDGLHEVSLAMKKFQEEQLNMGDFYEAWTRCKMQTKKVNTPFARRLVKAMETRQDFLGEPALLAALYMDPRYSHQVQGLAKHL